ncbi:MAG: hypothetical protein AVDCRST_MAG14-238 [uncultured Rubrobacteraceae bacterium]|uniref:HTH cro/C1-type domain-containing protein n=1 Tax=uncultured Rubrobacteraceae bacterium TaxID=349277 RepID=A0A6J4QLM7_9ACTN|nr:MAG: hypothetical protein AVDCRST_MAG14-238 [uncultured Rubrobacteraceae bacterium]
MSRWKPDRHAPALRNARLREGLSQKEIGLRVGVTQPTVGNWELARSVPPDKTIDKLERIFGLFTNDQYDEDDSAPSALGAWVNKRRVAKGWTVPELARQANVTAATIYNIESGRTSNLQKRTVRSLEKALGERLSNDTKKEIAENASIEGVGEFLDFDPYDEVNLPTTGGIYVLYDVSERPIYVGMASKIKSRIRDHKDKFWFRKPIVETASFVEITDDKQRREIERLLIKFLKSNAVINQQNVDR